MMSVFNFTAKLRKPITIILCGLSCSAFAQEAPLNDGNMNQQAAKVTQQETMIQTFFSKNPNYVNIETDAQILFDRLTEAKEALQSNFPILNSKQSISLAAALKTAVNRVYALAQITYKNKIESADQLITEGAGNIPSPMALQSSLIKELQQYRNLRASVEKAEDGKIMLELDTFELREQEILSQVEDLIWGELKNFGVIVNRAHLPGDPFGAPMTMLATGSTSDKITGMSVNADSLAAYNEDPTDAQLEIDIAAPFELKRVGMFKRLKIAGLEENFIIKYRPSGTADQLTDENNSMELINAKNAPVRMIVLGTGDTLELVVSGVTDSLISYALNKSGMSQFALDSKAWGLRLNILKDGVVAMPPGEGDDDFLIPQQGRNSVNPTLPTPFATRSPLIQTTYNVGALVARQLANAPLSNGIHHGNDWATMCENFIAPDGGYGKWGQALADDMKTHPEAFNYLVGKPNKDLKLNISFPKDLNNAIDASSTGTDRRTARLGPPRPIRPDFSSLSPDQKIRFWVWFAAAVSQAESGCGPTVTVKGVYNKQTKTQPMAAGLWQLHLGHTADYAHNACTSFNALLPTPNLLCGVRMLNNYIEFGSGANIDTADVVMWHGNYWQTMHLPDAGARIVLGLTHLLQFEK